MRVFVEFGIRYFDFNIDFLIFFLKIFIFLEVEGQGGRGEFIIIFYYFIGYSRLFIDLINNGFKVIKLQRDIVEVFFKVVILMKDVVSERNINFFVVGIFQFFIDMFLLLFFSVFIYIIYMFEVIFIYLIVVVYEIEYFFKVIFIKKLEM